MMNKISISPINPTKYIERYKADLRLKRAKAQHDREVRDLRTKVLEYLYSVIPRQKDLKQRTDLVTEIADHVVELLDEYTTKKAQEAAERQATKAA